MRKGSAEMTGQVCSSRPGAADLKRVASSPVAVEARSWSESVEAMLLADKPPGLRGGPPPNAAAPCKGGTAVWGTGAAGLGEGLLTLGCATGFAPT